MENKERFPEWFQASLEEFASTSRWLRREREPSMYGDEETGLPPHKIYTRSYASRALKEAKMVVDAVSKVISEGLSK